MLSCLKIRIDFDEVTEALTDEEKGRLLLAMLRYARTGEEPELSGTERILWPVFRAEIDHDSAVTEAWTENGKKGGRPRKEETKQNQTKPNETQQNQIKPNETQNNQTEPKENGVFQEKERDRESEREKEKVTQKEIEKEKEREKEKESDRTGADAGARADQTAAFERFWSAYPRKEGKKAARKAWDRLKPDTGQLDEIMRGLEKQKRCDQWQRDGGQFIPHPATWLHGERWKDETVIQTAGVAVANYQQRDYIGEQDEARRRMLSMIDEAGLVLADEG